MILHCRVVMFLIQLSWYVPQAQRPYVHAGSISLFERKILSMKERLSLYLPIKVADAKVGSREIRGTPGGGTLAIDFK